MARRKINQHLLYAGGLGLFMGAVTLARFDLVLGVFERIGPRLQGGGLPALRIVSEGILLFSILGGTVWLLSRRIQPAKDLRLAAAAALVGLAVEAWGTRLGLWSYYTEEAPPWWIVPAWALGALVVERIAGLAQGRWGKNIRPELARVLYGVLAIVTIAYITFFSNPAWGNVATWLVIGGAWAALLARPNPSKDFWLLVCGALCVLPADLWGTISGCWTYHLQNPGNPGAHAAGVFFGMLFDAAIVVAAVRLENLATGERSRRPRT